jgi:hypothetical protein
MSDRLYEDRTKEDGVKGKAKWEEPLLGPSDRTVSGVGENLKNLDGFYQNRSGTPDLDAKDGQALSDADFPDKGVFTKGTADHLKNDGAK